MRRRQTKQRVGEMLEAGCSRTEIADALGINLTTVSTHAIRLGYHGRSTKPKLYDWDAIRSYYEEGHSVADCREKFGFSAGAWEQARARGDVVSRPRCEMEHPHSTREAVARLLNDGFTHVQVSAALAISKSTVAYHARNLGIPPDERFNRRYDWTAVQEAIETEGLSRDQCMARFGFKKHAWYAAAKRGDITPVPHVVSIEALLVTGRRRNRHHVKTRLLRSGLKESRCERCGITEWQQEQLPMQLHHVNGDGNDNRLENLQLLCPNCHALTDNWGGRGVRRIGNRRNGDTSD
jgi:DNA-binding CsgD family transcriptional regulator